MNILNYYLKTCIVVILLLTSNLAFDQLIISIVTGFWDDDSISVTTDVTVNGTDAAIYNNAVTGTTNLF